VIYIYVSPSVTLVYMVNEMPFNQNARVIPSSLLTLHVLWALCLSRKEEILGLDVPVKICIADCGQTIKDSVMVIG